MDSFCPENDWYLRNLALTLKTWAEFMTSFCTVRRYNGQQIAFHSHHIN